MSKAGRVLTIVFGLGLLLMLSRAEAQQPAVEEIGSVQTTSLRALDGDGYTDGEEVVASCSTGNR